MSCPLHTYMHTYIRRTQMFMGALLVVTLCASEAQCVVVSSKQYVDTNVAQRVSTTGDESIQGQKTFLESPIVPTPPLP